jgi:hypothetical protein
LPLALALGWTCQATAGSARIYKVLPHLLDRQGRHALAPSLYERDAYQAYLRRHPQECSALRFDVHWRVQPPKPPSLKLRVELRTANGDSARPLVLEKAVPTKGRFSRWSSVTLAGESFQSAGGIIAWRATLWDGEVQLAEAKSFLW